MSGRNSCAEVASLEQIYFVIRYDLFRSFSFSVLLFDSISSERLLVQNVCLGVQSLIFNSFYCSSFD